MAAVEGTNSFGSSIRRALLADSIPVVEAKPPSKAAQSVAGKTDGIDALAAARSVLGHDAAALAQPRTDGPRVALSVLLAGRQRVEHQRTMNRNALNARVRQIDLGLDTRRALTDRHVTMISTWRHLPSDTVEQQIAREEAISLAVAIIAARARLKALQARLADLGEQLAPSYKPLVRSL